MGCTLSGGGGGFKSPIKAIIGPIANGFVKIDKKAIQEGGHSVIKGGMFYNSGLNDAEIGIIVLILSLIILIGALVLLVKLLHRVMKGKAAKWLRAGLEYNAYLSMVIGMAVTFVVQSSSITTSTLVPLVGEY
eukprot:GFYU01025499.1.p1 GENE.GFYU01025499.1~~GFYU01025499.1.p1  ORF type:complete len:133 (-),score=35.35 GFYU01025499.1:38-436(-)